MGFLIIIALLALCFFLVRESKRPGGSVAAIYLPVARHPQTGTSPRNGITAGEKGSPAAVRPALHKVAPTFVRQILIALNIIRSPIMGRGTRERHGVSRDHHD